MFWLCVLGALGVLYLRGMRIPAKLMDPVFSRLPDKLSAPLLNLRAADATG